MNPLTSNITANLVNFSRRHSISYAGTRLTAEVRRVPAV